MVSIENATIVSISTYDELKSIIQRGSEQRHTTGTLMNEQSSRSHLILSVIIESTNLQTQSVARGKVIIILTYIKLKHVILSEDRCIHLQFLFLILCHKFKECCNFAKSCKWENINVAWMRGRRMKIQGFDQENILCLFLQM